FKELDKTREYIGEKEELQKMANDYATKALARVHQQIRRFRFVQLEKIYVRSITDKAVRSETIENVKRNNFLYEDIAFDIFYRFTSYCLTVDRSHINLFKLDEFEKIYVRSITDKAVRSETIENVKRNNFLYEDIAFDIFYRFTSYCLIGDR